MVALGSGQGGASISSILNWSNAEIFQMQGRVKPRYQTFCRSQMIVSELKSSSFGHAIPW